MSRLRTKRPVIKIKGNLDPDAIIQINDGPKYLISSVAEELHIGGNFNHPKTMIIVMEESIGGP